MTALRYKARKETNAILLHDSHTDPDVVTGQEVQRWSALAEEGGLKMGLLGVGYHFIIERTGEVVETRRRHLVGTHTPGHNMDSIGICLVGGREKSTGAEGIDNFTVPQRRALLQLLASLREEYGDIPVKGHSEVQRYRNRCLADCPALDMEELRQDLRLFEHNGKILYDEENTYAR
jgi:N-acetyl-anhydromuramyl-L-alanine amidase AmpD